VDGNVLTLAFDREGNAKGFASSGSDGYLTDVLGALFGARMVVKTIVRAAEADDSGEPGRASAAGGAGLDPAGGQDGPAAGPAGLAGRPAGRVTANGAPDAIGADDGLSGTDLIMRELGGQVIHDIGEA